MLSNDYEVLPSAHRYQCIEPLLLKNFHENNYEDHVVDPKFLPASFLAGFMAILWFNDCSRFTSEAMKAQVIYSTVTKLSPIE